MSKKLTPETFGLPTNWPTNWPTTVTTYKMIENFETLLTPEKIVERVVSILISYKKIKENKWTQNNYKNRSSNNPYNQNKHLPSWEKYAKVVFKQAGIPEEFHYLLIQITKKYFYDEKNKKNKKNIRNILINALKNLEK